MQALGLLLLPYRGLALITLAVLRRFDSMELLHPVGPRLYVGRLPLPSEHAKLTAARGDVGPEPLCRVSATLEKS